MRKGAAKPRSVSLPSLHVYSRKRSKNSLRLGCLVSSSSMLYIVHACHHCMLWPVGGEDCWPLTLLSMLTACRPLVLVLNTSYILILMKALFLCRLQYVILSFIPLWFLLFLIKFSFYLYSTFQRTGLFLFVLFFEIK